MLKKDLTIVLGDDFDFTFRWSTTPLISKLITAISQEAPAKITCTDHGVPDGWSVAVVSANGMKDINAANFPPKLSDLKTCTKIDANSLTLDDVNSADWKAYTGGGYLVFYTPKTLTGYTARMDIKDKIGGTILTTLTSSASDITVDAANYKIVLALDAATTGALTWTKGVYDLELVSSTNVVKKIAYGNVKVTKEVTTTS